MGKQQRLKQERAAERARELAARDAQPRRSLPLTWIVVGALIVIALVVLIVLPDGNKASDKAKNAPVYSTITVTGSSLPAYSESGSDPAVGKRVPVVTGKNLDNKPMTIGEKGKPGVIMFVTHWCPHCQAEVPRIVDYLDSEGLPPGVTMSAVATATSKSRPNYPPAAWFEREDWPVPTMLDDEASTAGAAYGLEQFPYFVFVDADGTVVSRFAGEMKIDELNSRLKAIAKSS